MQHPRPAFLSCLLASTALFAQGDYTFTKTSPGTIGKPLTLSYSGSPANKNIVLGISSTAGPTPLKMINPGDTRSLKLGLEFATAWFAKASSGSGSFSLPVPMKNSIAGKQLHFQSFTLPGNPFIVDKISNDAIVQFGKTSFASPIQTTRLKEARAMAHSFINPGLSSSKGDLVIVGGGSGSLLGSFNIASSTEIYNFDTMAITPGPTMNLPRAIAFTVTLKDGRSLIIGGVDSAGNSTKTCEIYDPKSHKFTRTGSMKVARIGHAAALLGNGEVIVAGGTTDLSDVIKALSTMQNTCEIYDPKTGAWRNGPNISSRRGLHAMTSLPNGRALLSGGLRVNVVFGVPIPIGSVPDCEIYDPTSNKWTAAASMISSRAVHLYSTLALPNGNILAVGGVTSGPVVTSAAPIETAETYDYRADKWTAAPNMASKRLLASTLVLESGKVLVVGGAVGTLQQPLGVKSVQVYNPASNSWATLPDMPTARAGAILHQTPDNLVIIFGGQVNDKTTSNTLATLHL